jgi:DNA-directed RNA polymerase specialized sigma24 family protein
MTSDVYNECVKALAYGYTAATVAAIMEVSEEEVKSIADEKVAAKREELKGKGYIR